MKKMISSIFLYSILFSIVSLTIIPTVVASSEQHIVIDSVTVQSDVSPEIVNGRVMVPIRIVAENLGLKVEWNNEVVTLSNDRQYVTITTQNNIATFANEVMELDAKPYINQDRVFVPLRFIAETFGTQVKYENKTVILDSPPLYINGDKVKTVYGITQMTMETIDRELKGHSYQTELYELLTTSIVRNTDEPEHYGRILSFDIPNAYTLGVSYQFINAEGKIIKQFDLYALIVKNQEDANNEARYLIHDINKDQWYILSPNISVESREFEEKAINNGFYL